MVAVDGARIHPSADVDERAEVGPGTTVWHLAQIREPEGWSWWIRPSPAT
jgi:hypothetical protein